MATWAVEKSGSTWSVPDRDAMVRLARVGALAEDDLVKGPSDAAFQPASRHPELRDAFDEDPWAAWDDLADEDPDELWARLATLSGAAEDGEDPPTVDPGAEPSEPPPVVAEPERRSVEPESVAPEALEPEPVASPTMSVSLVAPKPKPKSKKTRRTRKPPAPRTAPAPSKKVVIGGGNIRPAEPTPTLSQLGGEVIDFPQPGQVRAELPAEVTATPLPVDYGVPGLATNPVLDIPPDPEPAAFQPLRVALLASPFLVGFLFLSWWVPHTATLGFGQVSERERAQAAAIESVQAAIGEDEQEETQRPADVYDALLTELHARIAEGALDVEGDDGLETALLIELSRMGLDIQSVKAKVKTWTGARANPIPEDVEIRVTLGTRGELERELASVGLVVGKYVLHYGLNADVFEVRLAAEDGSVRVRALNANAAARLYGGRSDLVTFLLDKPDP